jgi:hypothetical protein
MSRPLFNFITNKLMKNKLLLTAFSLLFVICSALSQELLDKEKNRDAELFVIKKGYDVQQRLKEIKSIEGKEVTVYHVTGKQNKIKLSYTGIAEMAKSPKLSDKDIATLIIVRINENGKIAGYFPLTNSNRFRIYLTEKMK